MQGLSISAVPPKLTCSRNSRSRSAGPSRPAVFIGPEVRSQNDGDVDSPESIATGRDSPGSECIPHLLRLISLTASQQYARRIYPWRVRVPEVDDVEAHSSQPSRPQARESAPVAPVQDLDHDAVIPGGDIERVTFHPVMAKAPS